jgi:TnpA family transposase
MLSNALRTLQKILIIVRARDFLLLESLRREISRELTANDPWNSANAFIFSVKDEEFASCKLEHQEILMPPLGLNRRYKLPSERIR